MEISEQHYISATNGKDNVYYRINVEGTTVFSEASYRQGWYDEDSVDALFGDISNAGSKKALSTRETIRKQIDTSLIQARQAYLEAVLAPKADNIDVQSKLEALKRVRLSVESATHGLDGAYVMDYDPMKNLKRKRVGQKMVMILSSDPDQILNKLRELTEDEKTTEILDSLVDTMRGKTDIESLKKHLDNQEKLIQNEKILSQLSTFIKNIPTKIKSASVSDTDRNAIVAETKALINILKLKNEQE